MGAVTASHTAHGYWTRSYTQDYDLDTMSSAFWRLPVPGSQPPRKVTLDLVNGAAVVHWKQDRDVTIELLQGHPKLVSIKVTLRLMAQTRQHRSANTLTY